MDGWGLLAYLAVGTTGGLVFLSLVADDLRRIRATQDARKAELDSEHEHAAHEKAVVEDREAAKVRRAERREKLLAADPESDTSSNPPADDASN